MILVNYRVFRIPLMKNAVYRQWYWMVTEAAWGQTPMAPGI